MRKGRDANFIYGENGEVMAVNLGADFTAEHEWGIKRMQQAFNINFVSEKPEESVLEKLKKTLKLKKEEPLFGIEKRRIQKVNEHLTFFERQGKKGKEYIMLFSRYFNMSKEIEKEVQIPRELYIDEKTGIGTAWDEATFGVIVTSEHKNHLEEIYQAFHDKDISIHLGGGGVFQNAGLVLSIVSRIPQQIKDEMIEGDRDRYRLENMAQETGIHQILKEANKRYYALSPRWKDETKTEVVFWLNPMEQNQNNFGLYGVEDLLLWSKNEGPIPMKKSM